MSELRLNTDGHIIKFGADNDVSLTHVADTGLLLNSTMQLQFNDASQNINAPSATVLDINATDEIELNATAVDLNGTLDVSGTLTQTGVATFSARSVHSSGITIADAGQIGSASDADAIAIASNGVVTFSQNPVFPDGGVAVADLDIDGATDIGAAIVDADLFIIDDGAGGTNRKVTASRLKTYAGFDPDASVTINDSGAAADFRVETDSITHMIYTDGGNNRLFFGTSTTDHSSNSNDDYGVSYAPGAAFQISSNGSTVFNMNRQNSDGNIINFYQEGSEEGNIAVSGSTIAYNTFCGTHWSRLADNSKPTIFRGTVIESIGTMMDWYQAKFKTAEMSGDQFIKKSITLPDGKSVGDTIKYTYESVEYDAEIIKEDNERLPKCKISDTADSKAVYGVFMAWDDQDNNGDDDEVNDMYIASLGSFVVRIHKDETVVIGNWLVSNGDGTAKVLAGNTAITADVQSSLIGKVTSTTKTHTHADDSYCVPCTLHCG